jgi:DNA-binding SARP family transcriptional activator
MMLSQYEPDVPPDVCVQLQLMTSFSLSLDGLIVDLPAASQRLVAYLGIARQARERSDIIDALWPHCAAARGTSNLRTARWHLAKVGPVVRCVGRSRFALCDGVAVDLHEVEAYGWALRDEPNGDACPAPTVIMHQHELLPGWYDDWVITERERTKQLNMRFAQVLVERLIRQRSLAEALDLAMRLVVADPLCDGNQRSLLLALCAEGSNGLAHNRLDCYRAQLAVHGIDTALSLPTIMEESCRLTPKDSHLMGFSAWSPTASGERSELDRVR